MLAERLGQVDHLVFTDSVRAKGLVGGLDPAIMGLSFTTKVVGPILLARPPATPSVSARSVTPCA